MIFITNMTDATGNRVCIVTIDLSMLTINMFVWLNVIEYHADNDFFCGLLVGHSC
jgi:hypothetical protein